MRYITVRQLQAAEGRLWAARPPADLDLTTALLWGSAGELATWIEVHSHLVDLHEVAPLSLEMMRGAASLLEKIEVLPPESLALVLLKCDRIGAGMDPLGDETESSRN